MAQNSRTEMRSYVYNEKDEQIIKTFKAAPDTYTICFLEEHQMALKQLSGEQVKTLIGNLQELLKYE